MCAMSRASEWVRCRSCTRGSSVFSIQPRAHAILLTREELITAAQRKDDDDGGDDDDDEECVYVCAYDYERIRVRALCCSALHGPLASPTLKRCFMRCVRRCEISRAE